MATMTSNAVAVEVTEPVPVQAVIVGVPAPMHAASASAETMVVPSQVVMTGGETLQSVLKRHDALVLEVGDTDARPGFWDGTKRASIRIKDSAGQAVLEATMESDSLRWGTFSFQARPVGQSKPVIRFARKEKASFPQPVQVACDGAPLGRVRLQQGCCAAGVYLERDEADSMSVRSVACQPKYQALCCAFLCFFPTCAVGSCCCFCYAMKADEYQAALGASGDDLGKVWTKQDGVHLAMEGWDTERKAELLVLALYSLCHSLAQMPKNNSSGGGGM